VCEVFYFDPNARQYRIIIPKNETTGGEIYFAAQEFQLLFSEATGETIEIISDAEVKSAGDGKFISLGDTALYESTGISISTYNLGENGFLLKTIEDDLYIVADTDIGVLFGVYGFMERAFAFDCFTADCYTIDAVSHFVLDDLDETDIPSIAIRNCGNNFILSDTKTLRRMRFTDRDNTLFIGSPSAHTAISYYLPLSTYYSEHSDWYSSDKSQLCYAAHGKATEYEAMQLAVLSKMKADGDTPKVCCATFSGCNISYDNETFTCAELTAVFGGIKCDLTNAIIQCDCAIQVSAIFGGIDILVPENMNVKVSTTSIFGGSSNKTTPKKDVPTLYISGICLFGGVDIK
jgi:hypothetical protein